MRLLGTLTILGMLLSAGAMVAQAPPFEMVANTKQVMLAMTIPSSTNLFNAGLEAEPTEEEWEALRNQALILAESANLLMMPGRAVDNTDWMAASKMMLEAGKDALAAIDKKDLDGLQLDVSEKILNACSTCHGKYMSQ